MPKQYAEHSDLYLRISKNKGIKMRNHPTWVQEYGRINPKWKENKT